MDDVLEARKNRALEYVRRLVSGNFPADLVSDDFTPWTVLDGTLDRDDYRNRSAGLGKVFTDEFVLEIDSIVGEGQHVVIEARGRGTLITGAIYDQRYCLHVVFNGDEQVCAFREYFESSRVLDTLRPAFQALAARNSAPA